MSFEYCVATPIKNSSYTRDVKIMNILAYTFAGLSLLLSLYNAKDGQQIGNVLQQSLITPMTILVLNFLVTIFFKIRHNAIVSDLYSNYQYFEVNIDKATQTLPEYVDYEVLFDRNEIKKGIPILYAYLQKRAELEQKELERARLRNVEHEKFNFDEAGVASSLVLERAMQEAENYIAERKKLMQDIEQINSEITQQEISFRDTTKEYQRQMQVSKEAFNNFKQQLEEVTSSIEANYLKKQQQQELDRQRNLERDYDTATDRHKKVIESYQNELGTIENEIKKIRTTLEKAMLSEFKTYSTKVYDEAFVIVEEREQEKYAKIKSEVQNLEETIVNKNKELEQVYGQNEELNNQLNALATQYQQEIANRTQFVPEMKGRKRGKNVEEAYPVEPAFNPYNYQAPTSVQPIEPVQPVQPVEPAYDANFMAPANDFDNNSYVPAEPEYMEAPAEAEITFNYLEEPEEDLAAQDNLGELESATDNSDSTIQEDESTPVRKVGRPRKVVDETEVKDEAPKRRGRPRKEVAEEEDTTPKRRGRPRKETTEVDDAEPKRRGRPRKEVTEEEDTTPKRRGRPRKVVDETEVKDEEPKRRGRPRKESSEVEDANEGNGSEMQDLDKYLQEINDQIAQETAKIEETTKELEKESKLPKDKK